MGRGRGYLNCSLKDSNLKTLYSEILSYSNSLSDCEKTPKKKVKQFHTVENSPGHKKSKTKQFAVSAVDCVQ